jgi:hypothetical protein
MASNDVWPVGSQTVSGTAKTLIEHWDGTSWSLLTTPSRVFGMDGVTALGDGTVLIVTTGGAILEH